MDWTRGGIDMDIPDKDLLAPGHRGCAGCGASIDVNASGICPYCGTVYNQEDKNWILSSMNLE